MKPHLYLAPRKDWRDGVMILGAVIGIMVWGRLACWALGIQL